MILPSNIHSYLKNLEMEQKWQQKQKEFGIFKTHTTKTKKDSYDIQNIINKLNSGKKLSAGEKAYLLKNNPSLYQKAVKIEREREDYAKELKRCKTKAQVMNAYMGRMQAISAGFKREGGSGDAQMSFMSISEEHKTFIRSKEYKRLPDEADEKKRDSDKKIRVKSNKD